MLDPIRLQRIGPIDLSCLHKSVIIEEYGTDKITQNNTY